jgi:uncharacterized protein (TIGR02266 family)
MVQEFLRLNSRRVRGDPGLSPEQQERWCELRGRIEEAMSGPDARHGDRRRTLRVPASLEVECADDARTALGSAQEISEGGIFLATERPFAVGTPLNLRLIGDRGETVEIEGAVVWIRRPGSGGGPPGVGIEFSTHSDAQRDAIAYLVEEALAALEPTNCSR